MLFATDSKDRIENNPEALQKLADLFNPSWLKIQADLISDTYDACFSPIFDAIKAVQSLSLPTFYIPTFQSPTLSLLSDTEEDVYEDEEFEIIHEQLKEDAYIPILGTLPTSWEVIAIQFLDRERARIIYPGLKGDLIMSYKDMGFADNRKIDEPDQNWKFLRALARLNGEMTWEDKGANSSVKKKKQTVKEKLCRLFNLEGDPFNGYSKKTGYTLRITLIPDNEEF